MDRGVTKEEKIEEDINKLFASFKRSLEVTIKDHKIDVIMGFSSEKLAAYFVDCIASIDALTKD